MKITADRKKLEREIYKALYDINKNKEIKNQILTNLINRGFSVGLAQQILNKNIALEFLDDDRLGLIALQIFNATYEPMVDPSLYFDIKELERLQKLKYDLKDEGLNFPIVFKNMMRLSDNRWVGLISIQDFVNLNKSGIVTYNFETQRNPIFERYKGRTIKKANINPKSVKEIADAMVSKQYKYDDITINILADGSEDFEFNVLADEKGNAIISNLGDIVIRSATLNLIDGAHREKGAETALLRDPTLEGNFILVLTYFDVDEANHYIVQKDKRNPIDKEYIEAKDITNFSNVVVKNINEHPRSELQGKIVTDNFLLKQDEGLTLFSTMSKTIGKLWEINTEIEARKLSNYLIAFFNELVGIFPDELKLKIKETKKNTLVNHPNMFIYYLTIAKEIQEEQNWKDLLEHIISYTDFSNSNEWKGTVTYADVDRKLNTIIRAHKMKIERIRGELSA